MEEGVCVFRCCTIVQFSDSSESVMVKVVVLSDAGQGLGITGEEFGSKD